MLLYTANTSKVSPRIVLASPFNNLIDNTNSSTKKGLAKSQTFLIVSSSVKMN